MVYNGILEGFQISKFDEGFMGGVFGVVDISGELRVDSLGGVLEGVQISKFDGGFMGWVGLYGFQEN